MTPVMAGQVAVTHPGAASANRDPADMVAARLLEVAGLLGATAPDHSVLAAIRRLLGQALPYPLHDPRYRGNSLNPGGLPVEVSFAEAAPRALRVDLAPGSPDAGPEAAARAACELAGVGDAELQPWRGLLAARGFGGFVAAALNPGDGLAGQLPAWSVTHKAYLELGRHAGVVLGRSAAGQPAAGQPVSGLPGRQAQVWQSAMAAIPGLRPHFLSLARGPDPRAVRLYFEATAGLALTTVVRWARGLGLFGPALAAAEVVRGLTGGAVVLPAAGLLLAVGGTPETGVETKLELPAGVLGADPLAAIRAILMARPPSQVAFARWCAAWGGAPAPTVVSVRFATGLATPTLNVYTGLSL